MNEILSCARGGGAKVVRKQISVEEVGEAGKVLSLGGMGRTPREVLLVWSERRDSGEKCGSRDGDDGTRVITSPLASPPPPLPTTNADSSFFIISTLLHEYPWGQHCDTPLSPVLRIQQERMGLSTKAGL